MASIEEIEQLKASLKEAEHVQADLDRRVFHLKTLYDVSKDIYGSVETETILRVMHAGVTRDAAAGMFARLFDGDLAGYKKAASKAQKKVKGWKSAALSVHTPSPAPGEVSHEASSVQSWFWLPALLQKRTSSVTPVSPV